MVEWYQAYADYEDAAVRLEAVVGAAAASVAAPAVDFSAPWRRITLREAIREQTGIDVIAARERPALVGAIESAGLAIETDGRSWAGLVDDLLSSCVEPTLHAPTFIFDYPVELSPFAKRHRSEDGLAERWEAYAGGIEIANAFSELNDPDEQRARSSPARGGRGRRRGGPAVRRGLPRRARAGDASDGGRRARYRPPRDAAVRRPSIREVVLFPAMRDT